MKFLSVCSGIEAASAAWEPLGWQAVGFSEIDPFASAVLAHRFPKTKNYGDMSDFRTWDIEPFDILVGGTPCQSFSVAGSRAGLTDPRGQLVYTFLDLVDFFQPKYVVWENVPGVLSDKTGVFRLFIKRLQDAGYLCDADILDAADFGVPQRRKRLFVSGINADYVSGAYHEKQEDNRDGRSIRNTPYPRDKLEQARHAYTAALDSAGAFTGGMGAILPQSESLCGNTQACQRKAENNTSGARRRTARLFGKRFNELVPLTQTAQTVAARYGTGGGNTPVVLQQKTIAFPTRNTSWTNPSYELFPALKASDSKGAAAVCTDWGVRFITPVECERLQGFPDNWTRVPYRGKPEAACPKSLRYKAIGNSMAVPVMRWIGCCIADAESRIRHGT